MDQKTILLLAAAGLGAFYLMNKGKQSSAPYAYNPATSGGYAYQQPTQPQTSTGQKIINTVQTGTQVVQAGKGLVDALTDIFGKKPATAPASAPSFWPSNVA